jgi:hypothetical protein
MTMISFWSYTQIEGRELTASIAFASIIVFNELQFSLTLIPEVIIRLFETLVRYISTNILFFFFEKKFELIIVLALTVFKDTLI